MLKVSTIGALTLSSGKYIGRNYAKVQRPTLLAVCTYKSSTLHMKDVAIIVAR